MPQFWIHRRTAILSALAAIVFWSPAAAETLSERVAAGEPVRLGYSEYAPWSYTDAEGTPRGFMNIFTIAVLKRMGIESVETIPMDWGALTPALKAGRIDINTGGMFINPERCLNVAFTEPMMRSPFALVVSKGNPKDLNNFGDIIASNAILAGFAGGADLIAAQKAGIPKANIMALPGLTEILAAFKAKRADAILLSGAQAVLDQGDNADILEIANEDAAPDATNYAALALRLTDADFVARFNAVQADYLGSAEMMAAVLPEGYRPETLPKSKTLAELCAE